MSKAIPGEEIMPHVCPWWSGYFIDNPLRRMLHDSKAILKPYVKPGMMVMDVGCGMGMLDEIHACRKSGGKLLVAEPQLHVPGKAFQQTVATTEAVGFKVIEEPQVRWCRAVMLSQPRRWR